MNYSIFSINLWIESLDTCRNELLPPTIDLQRYKHCILILQLKNKTNFLHTFDQQNMSTISFRLKLNLSSHLSSNDNKNQFADNIFLSVYSCWLKIVKLIVLLEPKLIRFQTEEICYGERNKWKNQPKTLSGNRATTNRQQNE